MTDRQRDFTREVTQHPFRVAGGALKSVDENTRLPIKMSLLVTLIAAACTVTRWVDSTNQDGKTLTAVAAELTSVHTVVDKNTVALQEIKYALRANGIPVAGAAARVAANFVGKADTPAGPDR